MPSCEISRWPANETSFVEQLFFVLWEDTDTNTNIIIIFSLLLSTFVNSFVQKYQKLLFDALKEFSEKDVELEFEPLDDDGFGKLMASNEWTMDQVLALTDIICE